MNIFGMDPWESKEEPKSLDDWLKILTGNPPPPFPGIEKVRVSNPPSGVPTTVNVAKDNVNNPAHYNHNRKGIEAITAIEASMTADEFLGYLKGNIIKYLWRYRYKNQVEDLNKAQWYLNLMIGKYKESLTGTKAGV